MNDPIEAEVVEERSTALATRADSAPAVWTPSFAVAVDDAIERKKQKRRFFEGVMDEGVHYGVIPGTKSKPTLLKSGAEMLLANMGLAAELSDAEPPIRDYDGSGAGAGEGLIVYRRICRIYKQTGPRVDERMKIAQAEGSCSSRESKYRWRDDKPACPKCSRPLFRSKDGGWFCWRKKDGCGAQFGESDVKSAGKIPNPDLADIENTILKMADKRALVAATLIATGCSDIFTQDAEDLAPPTEEIPPPQDPPKQHDANPVKERLKQLLCDERIIPHERDEAIKSVTGSIEPSSITSPELAQQVIAKLEAVLTEATEENPW